MEGLATKPSRCDGALLGRSVPTAWCRGACRQVSGLPTNIAFLQRLAAHPAFAAAELDTGFIARHLESLTQRMDPPLPIIALAAVTDHLLQTRVRVQHLKMAALTVPRSWHAM